MSNEKIPQTDSFAAAIKELAQFWQTHDVTDFEDELEEICEPVFKKEEHNEQLWDEQIERDLEAGRLDALLEQVDKEYQEGLSK